MTTATPPIPSAAYRQALLLLQRQQRAQMTTLIAQTEATIAADWQRGGAVVAQYYAPLLDRYARALDDLRRASDDPAAALSLDWLTGQQSTLKSIEASAAKTINRTAAQSAERITEAQSAAVQRGAGDAYALGQRALSPAFEQGYPPGVLFNRPNPDALAQWVGRAGTGHPLGDLFANFAPQAASEARKAMMLGLAMGDNPREMARGLANALGINRSRAIIISRTEVLGSYRSAAHETYRRNSDVLNGWLWSAGGANPCAGCMGMDGLIFSLNESLLDHPCGKCAPLPITKPWSDILGPLGIDVGDMPETSLGADGAYFGGEEKFATFSPEKQRAIIGTRTGYEAYKRGEVSLRDFVGRRPDGMIYQKSLRELQIPTGRANVHNAHLVEPSPTFAKVIAGEAKLLERGARTPLEEMPAWARATPARQQVYQILRNGLPWQLSAQHERPLLMMNLEEMLKEADLPLNVRLAAMRQLDVLREYETYLKNNLWNVWHTAASTLERPGEFVYSPTKRLERELAVARAAARAGEQTAAREAAQVGEQAARAQGFSVARMSAQELEQANKRIMDLIGVDLNDGAALQRTLIKAEDDLAARLRENADFQKVSDALVQSYAREMQSEGFSAKNIADAIEGLSYSPQEIVESLVRAWGSGGSNEKFLALQQAIRDEFGLANAAEMPASAATALQDWQEAQPGLRAFVRAMYENTQATLRANDITEIPIYRGLGFERLPDGLNASLFDGQAHEAVLSLRAASSFSADPAQALRFATTPVAEEEISVKNALVIAARVPSELVLGLPQTGFGTIREYEIVVLGGEQPFVVVGVDTEQAALTIDQIEQLLVTGGRE